MRNMKAIFIIIFITLISLNNNFHAENGESNISLGGEIDLFPLISGGYYGSVFYGYENIRVRLIYAKSNVPKFVLPEGFDKNALTVYALLTDYFLNNESNINKWWVGAGFELWKNKAHNNSENIEGEFDTYIATAGFGYVFYITDNIYLNPWAALHLRIAGNKEVSIGNALYKNSLILPEISIKIGVII